MVGHEAVRQQRHFGKAACGLFEDFFERGVVGGLEEETGLADAAVEHVVHDPRRVRPSPPRHEKEGTATGTGVNPPHT